ncbi:peptide/nickel transport system substrate-binding protein [Microbacterium sp. ru370.1]|uniref:ABC transporter substrate-binding protein n=1 Tax=unclassified Microbacterium TaxID=2609290 RepID=UPI0008826F4C|nr:MULTISPECIES: ABC transporter substrate-binding protein [unclassified Microbacterium]SDO54885.1 peptide/nickel transport system substrate-binding protein [Microbacterium sp. ru370.1]SIT84720.1 peptide/nickel transport system substrate-binding protein [Microbacterium sp. RU1D]
MLRRTALATSTLLIGALMLTSCTGPTASPGPTGDPDPNATLTVRLSLEPSNLDIRHTSGASLEQALIDNVYQGLVTRDGDQDNAIVPALATAWEVSPDGLTYTFTLREGVTFHDGSALTADDVVTSLQTAKDDATIQNSADLAGVASIASPDATTVVVTLAQPNIDFLFALTGRAGLVFKNGDTTNFQTSANGTGPFRVESWNTGQSLTLARYDEYWGEKAGVAEVVLDYIPDQSAATNAAVSGDIDVALEIDPELQSQIEGTGDFTIESGLTTDKGTLAFNNAKAPLSDQRVREALRLAIDHSALAETLITAQPLNGPIPPLDPGYEDLTGSISYNPDRARELLAEAGAENLDLTLTIPNVYPGTLATFLVSSFADVGVTLKVDQVDFSTWLTDVYTNHDYDLSFVRHVEARDFGNWANPSYYFGYDNPEVQSLYAQALATTDEQQSSDLLAEAARIVDDEDAADWLFLSTPRTAIANDVAGFPKNSLNVRLPLAGVTVAAE